MLEIIKFCIDVVYMICVFQWVELCSDMLQDKQDVSSVLSDSFLPPFRTTKF